MFFFADKERAFVDDYDDHAPPFLIRRILFQHEDQSREICLVYSANCFMILLDDYCPYIASLLAMLHTG